MVTLVSVPFTLLEAITAGWILGLFMCKLVSFLTVLSSTSSVLTLMCIALDRYNAICQPYKSRVLQSNKRAIQLLSAVWVISVIIALPLLYVSSLREITDIRDGKEYALCVENWYSSSQKMAFTFFVVAMTYLVPLALMVVLYARIWHYLWVKNTITSEFHQMASSAAKRKKKATQMLILVVFLFFVCWTPYHIVTIRREFPKFIDNETNRLILAFITLLAFSNSFNNPIVYAFLNGNFKQCFLATLKCKNVRHENVNCDTLHPPHGDGGEEGVN
ncbi:QRFP-like peptide receptor [Saccoglossus kowalevskii]